MAHKAGFVAIIGKPNVGKSTLLNKLLGTQLTVVTPKAQTTRHRIKGILNTDDYQVVFSDTPGILKPAYNLHKRMMKADDIIITTQNAGGREKLRAFSDGYLSAPKCDNRGIAILDIA